SASLSPISPTKRQPAPSHEPFSMSSQSIASTPSTETRCTSRPAASTEKSSARFPASLCVQNSSGPRALPASPLVSRTSSGRLIGGAETVQIEPASRGTSASVDAPSRCACASSPAPHAPSARRHTGPSIHRPFMVCTGVGVVGDVGREVAPGSAGELQHGIIVGDHYAQPIFGACSLAQPLQLDLVGIVVGRNRFAVVIHEVNGLPLDVVPAVLGIRVGRGTLATDLLLLRLQQPSPVRVEREGCRLYLVAAMAQ